MFTLEVTAVLAGERASWSPRMGGAPLDMRSDGTRYDWPVLGLALVAVLCLGALVAVLVLRVVRSTPCRPVSRRTEMARRSLPGVGGRRPEVGEAMTAAGPFPRQ